MRTILGRVLAIGRANPPGRNHKPRTQKLAARVEALERRALLTGGGVVQNGALIVVTPAPGGPNTAVVSYQVVNGTTALDVNLNGVDKYFSLGNVGFVYYEGASTSGSQTFENNTSLHTVAWGGTGANLFESDGGAQDEFIGGAGSNTFDAGSGFDVLIGGTGANVFNENQTGSGEILEAGTQNTINVPPGSTGHYTII